MEIPDRRAKSCYPIGLAQTLLFQEKRENNGEEPPSLLSTEMLLTKKICGQQDTHLIRSDNGISANQLLSQLLSMRLTHRMSMPHISMGFATQVKVIVIIQIVFSH